MFSVKTLTMVSALAITSVGIIGTEAAQAGVVVKSSGPSAKKYPVGKKLGDASAITLKAGDSLTVLTATGTRVLSGAGVHRVAGRTKAKRSAFAVLTRRQSGARVRTGAVRSAVSKAPASNSNIWNVDMSQLGRICLPDAQQVRLWRPATSTEQTYKFGAADAGVSFDVTFGAGASTASVGTGKLPLTGTADYVVSVSNGGAAKPVEFVVLENTPRDPEALAQAFVANGCDSQLELLASTMMVPAG